MSELSQITAANYLSKRLESLNDSNAPSLNTNVAFNSSNTNSKLDKADLEKKMYYDSKDKNKLIKEILSNSDVIFNNYTIFLKKLINDFQDLKIILNVHPFEGKEHYKKIFSEEKNVLILKNNFLLPQLYFNYDFIINYNSTTCAETLLSNKKSLSVNFVDPNNVQNKYYNNFSIPFQNYDDLKKFINNYEISKKKLSEINVETKNSLNFLYNNANNDALSLISNALNKINVIKDEKKVKLTTKYFLFFKYFIFFSYDKINLFKAPLRIFKLIIIFILNSNNFYLLKEKIFENYKKKHISIKKIDLFFKKLNKNKLEKKRINYSKPSILRFLFRHLIVIKINKYL